MWHMREKKRLHLLTVLRSFLELWTFPVHDMIGPAVANGGGGRRVDGAAPDAVTRPVGTLRCRQCCYIVYQPWLPANVTA